MRKKILDIGSGLDPHPRATHAIDELTQKRLERLMPTGRHFHKVKFQGGVDYNRPVTRKSCDQFDAVMSRYSMDVYGNQQAYRNAHCLLKCGGEITIRGGDTRSAQQVKKKLERAGFKDIQERIIPTTYQSPTSGRREPAGDDFEIRARKVCERGTPRSRR